MPEETFKYANLSQRPGLLEWLKAQFDDAVKCKLKEFCWCLDCKKEEDTCLSISGYTVPQIRDDIEKKKLPLRILRVFQTNLSFEDQTKDL